MICYFTAPGIRHSEIKVLTVHLEGNRVAVRSSTQGTTRSSGLLSTAPSSTPSIETEARLNLIQAAD